MKLQMSELQANVSQIIKQSKMVTLMLEHRGSCRHSDGSAFCQNNCRASTNGIK